MKRISSTVPALAEIAAALRKTTEVLAHELVVPTSEPPRWTGFEWRVARAVSAMQGVSALLAARLLWPGPPDWRLFLHDQQQHSVLRYIEITRVLKLIASHAGDDGVAVVALKGAALYEEGVYAAGERPMGDIDLLVYDKDLETVARLISASGYEAAFASRRHDVFQPRTKKKPGRNPGEHIDNPIKIEVHTKIAEQLPFSAVDITHFLLDGAERPGVNTYPSRSSLLLHLLLHAAGNMRARALRLIQLHDIALLAVRMDDDDWQRLHASGPNGKPPWWIWPPLCLAAKYYPDAIKLNQFGRERIECPLVLRKFALGRDLSDVSWSNIRIAAFPGLEWSRTPLDALAFMKSRVWPSRTALLELSGGAAQIPGAATVPWYGISHGARILRWMFSKPPRVQTLLAVREVLMQD